MTTPFQILIYKDTQIFNKWLSSDVSFSTTFKSGAIDLEYIW